VLRDALRGRSVGVIEVDAAKGITRIAKPAGVIASLIPTTNPELTPPVTGIFAIKCKDAVIFSPHPRAKATTFEMVRVMRATLEKLGAPQDLFQCVKDPSIPLTGALMAQADLTLATGGKAMVKAAYSSGKPACGVGAGNATMVIDETADILDAARNSRISKTSDYGSGCSADGNLLIDDRIYDALRISLVAEGGICAMRRKKRCWKPRCGTARATAPSPPSRSRRKRSRGLPASPSPRTASSSWWNKTASVPGTVSRRKSFAS